MFGRRSLLQFAVSLALPREALDQLRDKAAALSKLRKDEVRLAAIPIKAATVHLMVPRTGELIACELTGKPTDEEDGACGSRRAYAVW